MFESGTQQALAAIVSLSADLTTWSSAVEISRHLRDDSGINLHWRTIDALLAKNRSMASRRKRARRWEYRILGAGRAAISAPDEAVTFVNPTTAVQATLKLHDVLAKLKGTVRVCDPYLDQLTLEHLEACGVNKPIRLLTMKVKDTGPLRRVIDALGVAGHPIEIRVVNTRTLHDRYVIDDESMLILGASLNGFGKKQSFVIQAGTDIRATVLSAYEEQWRTAAVWP